MARAFWVTGPSQGQIRPALQGEAAATATGRDLEMAQVKTLYSGISRGTESLVFANRIPQTEYLPMRAPFQEGDFPFPVKYGYANVGCVTDGPENLKGRSVFCLFPHQDDYQVPAQAVIPLPEDLPEHRAVLAANMETAINGLWDSSPGIGDRIAVVGLGVVGCLVAWLASRIPGTRVTAIDINPKRRAVAEALGLNFVTDCAADDHDLVVHASGHPSGLDTALRLCGVEARLTEMSWYGTQPVAVPLGQAFHSRRLTLRSSQVGQLAPGQKPRWTHRSRMQLALRLLCEPGLDHLVSGESPFEQLPQVMASLAGQLERPDLPRPDETLCHRIVY